ncbi:MULTISPECIES: DUF421 domain-containing protein [Xanthomonas]|uniref:DUF421 domain-containing protein n=7 Tax=Xanthomonas arboricola TaxID=56448 RepID=A0AAQ1AMK9_9XANT|nr:MULTISPECIES: YetF domain-containing protein [Xanthomonas]GAE52314.1 hypothetical protein XPU_3846 [Xanthomonas arboricola pv. pruni str. MAFF 311562]GAE55001.1 hypothetical protein XPR_1636 [Xanthomonas arboricola pv. pruni MAFF 301420]GAE59099.1 hypothetical protein XPN_1005 [Xanthomonas arboricola pv. pruni MAFF 301427]AKU49274.1 hypothetical protein AKJ12_05395 [Xanthomonas arboricola pv. juglandis]KCW99080.1 membrane protein [Xanthomonas arboricola pv. pruni]
MLDVETRVRFYEMMHLDMPWWEFVLRAVAVYTVVLLLTRMTGKRALGQSTPFDVLLIVLLGTAVQNSLIGKDVSLLGGMILAATLLVLNWLVGMATARSRRIDTWVQGTPALLARGGEIYWKELVRHNVSYADFEVAKRKADCRDDADIDMAILETSGEISILKKR